VVSNAFELSTYLMIDVKVSSHFSDKGLPGV
jgi:hypothetical protein